MNNPILSAETISAGYDGRKILSDVSLTLPEKKISVILGANGCGKSTLLKTFARLLKPDYTGWKKYFFSSFQRSSQNSGTASPVSGCSGRDQGNGSGRPWAFSLPASLWRYASGGFCRSGRSAGTHGYHRTGRPECG